MGWLRQVLGLQNDGEQFVGRDFNGRDVVVQVDPPSNSGPGYYEYEYLQDGGGGVMMCGSVIRAESFRDAVVNGPRYIRDKGFACQIAYGNMPERVRRLPDELQELSLEDATSRWKSYPEYDAPVRDRINPWRLGPVRSGRSGW